MHFDLGVCLGLAPCSYLVNLIRSLAQGMTDLLLLSFVTGGEVAVVFRHVDRFVWAFNFKYAIEILLF